VVWRGTMPRRFSWTLLSLFAGLATLLAAIGLYGLLGYSIRQRTGEMGIRIALGATPARVIAMVLSEGLKPAAAGVLTGLAVAAAVGRVIERMLFEVEPLHSQGLLLLALLLLAVAAISCPIPPRPPPKDAPA